MQTMIGALLLHLAMAMAAPEMDRVEPDFEESLLDDLFGDVQTFKEDMKTRNQQR